MNWKSFVLGFLAGIAVLSALSHWRARQQNVIASWPDDDNKKAMEMLAPWVTKARAGNLGPFVVLAPATSKENAEAILQPAKGKNPLVYVTRDEISIIDSRRRLLSATYDSTSGALRSYSYTADLLNGPTFIDRGMTGALERISPPAKKR